MRPHLTAYIIVDIEINDSDSYKEYIRLITPTLKKYSGRYLVRGGDPETLDGEWRSKRIVVMQYPSRKVAKSWLNDPDLKSIHDMRRRNSKKCNMILCDGIEN